MSLERSIQEEHWGFRGFKNHFIINCDCGKLIGKCRCPVPDDKRVAIRGLCDDCKIKELEGRLK